MKRIRFSEDADADVNEQYEYLKNEVNNEIAEKFFHAISATARWLAENPRAGRLREFENSELTNLRSFHVLDFNKHLIFYRDSGEFIYIIAVLHGSRDLNDLFQDE